MSSEAQGKTSFSDKFIRFFDRWTPNSMVFAYLLTIIVSVLALIFTDATLFISKSAQQPSLIDSWVKGFWNLLMFAMQMTLIMITGSVVATAPPVRRLLQKLALLPNNAFQAFLLALCIAPVVTWIHWGLGMMVTIQIGRQIVLASKTKGYKIHLPGFIAFIYGSSVGGIGISQASPLMGATPNGLRSLVPEALRASIPEVVPLTQSVLLPQNIAACLILFVLVFLACWVFRPKTDDKIIEASPELIAEIEAQSKIASIKVKATTPSEWIDNHLILSIIVGVAGLAWIIKFIATEGLNGISINNYNFIMLFLGLLLCGSPNQFIKSVQGAVGSCWGVLIQFPFYAGIFGIIVYTGFSDVIVRAFLTIATKENFPFIVVIYSSILNMAVPSAGSKFVIEAPYILDVATRLKLDIGVVLNAYCAGDLTTNMIQPFWALPYLAMFKLDFKKILPFTVLACIAAYVVYSIFFLFVY